MEIGLDEYQKIIHIEAGAMLEILRRQIIPASIRFAKDVAQSVSIKASLGLDAKGEKELVRKLTSLTDSILEEVDKLDILSQKGQDEVYAAARFCADEVIPQMAKCRALSDSLETMVDKTYWPIPTYSDILFY